MQQKNISPIHTPRKKPQGNQIYASSTVTRPGFSFDFLGVIGILPKPASPQRFLAVCLALLHLARPSGPPEARQDMLFHVLLAAMSCTWAKGSRLAGRGEWVPVSGGPAEAAAEPAAHVVQQKRLQLAGRQWGTTEGVPHCHMTTTCPCFPPSKADLILRRPTVLLHSEIISP